MGGILFLVFILVPLVEIGVFIEVGGRIGLWPTIGVVVLTAAVGTWLIRLQGMATLARAQAAVERNEVPVAELLEGLCLLLGGALLLTPGFVTDAMGFVFLIPPLRRAIGAWLWRLLQRRGGVHTHGFESRTTYREGVIEGEFHEVSPEQTDEPAAEGGDLPGRGEDEGRRDPDNPEGTDRPDRPDGEPGR